MGNLSWAEADAEYHRIFKSVGGDSPSSGLGRKVWEDFYVSSIRDDQPKHWPYEKFPPGIYDTRSQHLMLAEECKAQVFGIPVYCTNHHPVNTMYYYDQAFFCGPGRYKLDDFYKLKTRVEAYNLKDSREMPKSAFEKCLEQEMTMLMPPKEKEVTQYQALLPVDLEKHLYSGSTLYDLENDVFRKIASVSKVSRKSGYSTTITFFGGTKRIFSTTEALEKFAKSYRWVTLREMPVDPTLRYDIPTRSWVQQQLVAAKGPDTIHHYSRQHRCTGDTGITHIGMVAIQELVAEQVVQAMKAEKHTYFIKGVDSVPLPKKRRWFR